MTKTNNSDAFRVQRGMLYASGIWPEQHPTIFYRAKTIISWILSTTLFLTMIAEVVVSITDVTKLAKILYVTITHYTTFAKIGALTYYKKVVLEIVDYLKNPIFSSYPDEVDHYMAKTVRASTTMAKVYRIMVGVCIVMIAAYPIYDHKPLPFPFSFDLGGYVLYMYAFQSVSIGVAAWSNSSVDTFAMSLMGISAAQLDILREKIVNIHVPKSSETNEISECEADKYFVDALKQCVEHHNAITRLIKYIEEVFAVVLFSQFVSSVLIICNTVFQIVLMSSLSFQFLMLLQYFFVMMWQLFLYCWYANEIILKSTQIGDACYKSKWYDRGRSVRSYLFIIMERSKRPETIKALKFSDASLVVFTSILQWSYSCLALLLKMYEKKRK